MTFTITPGWWLLPLAITIVAFVKFVHLGREDMKNAGMFGGLGVIFYGSGFLIVTLFSWLVYFATLHFIG